MARVSPRLALRGLLLVVGALLGVACAPQRRDGVNGEPSAAGTTRAGEAPVDEPSPAAEDAIAWVPYAGAFERAAREGKPVIVVMTAGWCEHCRTYQGVLSHPEVVRLSRSFVMVRVDIDAEADVNRRHAPDGTYVPRTLFFGADGTPREDLRSPNRERYVHFLDTTNPAELLGLMRRATAG